MGNKSVKMFFIDTQSLLNGLSFPELSSSG